MPPRQLQLIRLSDHHGIIRDGTGRLDVTAPAAMSLVERVVEGLNRGDSAELIMSGLPAPSRASVASLLAELDPPVPGEGPDGPRSVAATGPDLQPAAFR